MGATINLPILSRDRIEPGSYNTPLGQFPKTCSSTDINPNKVAAGLISQFNNALSAKDYQAVSNLFLENGYWRDHLCLSWDFRTLKGTDNISNFLSKNHRLTSLEIDRSSAFRAPHVGPIDAFGEVTGVEFFANLTTELGRGRAVARLAEVDGTWRFSTLFTSLEELKGHEESVNHRRPKGVEHGEQKTRKNWLEQRIDDINFVGKNPAVIVIGTDPVLSSTVSNICRCWPKWAYSCCSAQNAQCRHSSDRPRGPYWR